MKDQSKLNNPATKAVSQEILKALEEKGQRQTRTRSRIAERLGTLARGGENFTVEGLWRDLQKQDPHIGRATIFRAVEILSTQGLLNRVEFANGSHSYRVCGKQHHHHLTCRQCHRVVEIDVCIPEGLLRNIGKRTDFQIEGHALALFGLCPDCRS